MRPGLAVLLLGLACADASKEPARIAWDRDTCRGCSMAISDHHFAAEVRGGPKGKTEKFDDIGCAVRWLEKQSWAVDPAVTIWVADHESGAWLDARSARYTPGAASPMGFNFAASAAPGDAGLSFEALRAQLHSTASR